MQIIDEKTIRKIVGEGTPSEGFRDSGIEPDSICARAIAWAEKKYSDAARYDHRAYGDFGTLIEGYVTGAFGGFGIPPVGSDYERAELLVCELTRFQREMLVPEFTALVFRVIEISMFPVNRDPSKARLLKVITLLAETKNTIKSKTVEEARKILESIIGD